MATTSTPIRTGNIRNFIGDRKVTVGVFTAGPAVESGTIDTGLNVCEFMTLTITNSSVVTASPTVGARFPLAGTAVPIITSGGTEGSWIAYGY